MILFSYILGLRPKECYCAEIKHLDLINNYIYIPSKNNKQRQDDFIPIPNFLLEKLIYYLKLRNKYHKNSKWLFPNRKDEHITLFHFHWILREALKKSDKCFIKYFDKKGIPRYNLNLYSLRHGFGTKVMKKTDLNLFKTAIALRHKDSKLRTTMKYVHIVDSFERKNIMIEVYSDLKKIDIKAINKR